MMGLMHQRMLHGAAIASLFLLLAGPVTGVTVYNDAGGVDMELGEQLRSHIIVYNPLDEENTVSLSASPTMPSGTFTANIIAERRGDRVQIDIAAESNRTVPVLYTASLCSTRPSCLGHTTFNARSLESGSTSRIDVPVNITHQQEVYGSPGITDLQFVVIALLGATLLVLAQKGRRSRRSSDRPDT